MRRTHTFAVVLEPEEEGGFTVRVPSIPEIVTYGQDEHEALAMAEDAIRWCSKIVQFVENPFRPTSPRAFVKSPSHSPHE
jgi:predicted RNase H-like HicB family nuclease